MRYKDISNKEIIDLKAGTRLGVLGQADLEINIKTGKIESFIIPNYKWFGLKRENEAERIKCTSKEKIEKKLFLIIKKISKINQLFQLAFLKKKNFFSKT